MRGKKPILLKQIADEGIDIAARQGFPVTHRSASRIVTAYIIKLENVNHNASRVELVMQAIANKD